MKYTWFFSGSLRRMVALGCGLLLLQSTQAQTLRLHGAVSLAKTLEAKKAALEAQSGVKIEIVGNGAGRGLADLAGGQADVAMLAGALKGVAEAMNKEKPGSVDAATFKEFSVGGSKLGFYTHPSAGIKSITDAQLRDVLTGKITNWKEVGGADLPIKVVVPFGADGSRVTAQSLLFPDGEYAKSAIVRTSAKDMAVVLNQLPGTCAILAAQNAEGSLVSVATGKEMIMPWSLVVKGEPSADMKKLIEAAQALAK